MNYKPKLIYCQPWLKSLEVYQDAILNPQAILKLLTVKNEYFRLQKSSTVVLPFGGQELTVLKGSNSLNCSSWIVSITS